METSGRIHQLQEADRRILLDHRVEAVLKQARLNARHGSRLGWVLVKMGESWDYNIFNINGLYHYE